MVCPSRGQPFTVFRSVPHILSFVKPQAIDELTGTFNALNETTNFMPTQGDGIGVIHPSYKPDPRGYDPGPIGSLSETFGERGYSPISGEGVFKPQDIDTKGSVIWGDNHFKPGRGGDSLTGEGRPTNSWRNADPSPFEDRMPGDFDANDFHACPNKVKDLAGNFGDAAGNMTETFAGSFNLQQGDLPFECDTFQPAAGMNSFGRSLNPVLEVGACNGYDCTNAGSCSDPAVLTAKISGTSGPGGTSF